MQSIKSINPPFENSPMEICDERNIFVFLVPYFLVDNKTEQTRVQSTVRNLNSHVY